MIKETSLGTICDIYSAGDKPKCFSKISLGLNNVPVYGNGRDNSGLVGFTDKATMTSPAVTVAARGSSCGATFYRDTPYTPIVRLISLIAKSGIDTKYLYYQVCNRHFKGSGSGQPQITIPDIADAPIYLETDILIQKKIADVLYTIDSKISNNASICADLEGMAKLLYDYWFVQFDFPDENGKPYKSSGGKMVWNEELKREIPDGWEVKPLSDVFNITMGSSPSGASLNENGEGIEFYQGSTDFGDLYPTERVYTTAPVRFAKAQDVLLSVRAPVGDMNIAMNDCCIGRGLAAIHHNCTLYAWCSMLSLRPYFDIYNGSGTTFGALTSDDLKGKLTVCPKESVLNSFVEKVNPISQKLRLLSKETQQLASLRDFLLPMLMNGQVKIKE